MSRSEAIAGLGNRTDYVAPAPGLDVTRLALTPEQSDVLAAVGRVARIADIIAGSGLDEPLLIATLLALRAKGAIVPARLPSARKAGEAPDSAMAEDVEIDDDRKRQILELDRKLDRCNHFEVLGIPAGSSPDAVKKAYYEASRRFHPDRFFNKKLGSFGAKIDRIFKRLTESQAILTDPQRRAQYLKANPRLAVAAKPAPKVEAASPEPVWTTDTVRGKERQTRLAKHPYLAKSIRLNELLARSKSSIAKGEFGRAYSDLTIAAQMDPKNHEIQLLQQQTRKKHDIQRSEVEIKKGQEAERMSDWSAAAAAYKSASTLDGTNALAHYKAASLMLKLGNDPKEAKSLAQRAVELEPKSADYRYLLGLVFLGAGMKKLAKSQFEEALKADPQHAEAKSHLKKTKWVF